MFDWLFPPSCPCDLPAKEWVERLERLAEEFDQSAFTGREIILPTNHFFPASYHGTERSVRRFLDRV